MSLFAELKRRNVFRVGFAYAVTSWLLIQVTDILFESIGAPPWVMQAMFVVLAAGLVIALFFAWAFELTPDGVKKEKDVDRSASISPRTGKKLNLGIVALLVITLAYVAYDKLVLDGLLETGSVAELESPDNEELGPEPFSQHTSGQATEAMERMDLTPAPAPADTQKSIVVLPFVNMSNDPEQEFFSDGLSEELLNVLAQIKDLRVISRTSAFAFKDKNVSIPEIAATLNVSHVLEGSVRRSGEDIRITAQLIEVATDSHLWSDAYNRKLENIFEVQEEISKAIAAELQVTLGTGGNTGKPTNNIEAWQLFLRGRHLYQTRGEKQIGQSLEVLRRAVDLDPEFADAWANLAAASWVHAFRLDENFETYYESGLQAAMRAIEIDPDNGFAHALLGMEHFKNLAFDHALREFDLAIQLNPNETNSLLWKGIFLLGLGYIDQAVALLHRAEQIDPVFTNLQYWLFTAYSFNGDYESMWRSMERIQRVDPEWEFDDTLGVYELAKGNLDAAEQIDRAREIKQTGKDILSAALYAALRDPSRKEETVKILEREMADEPTKLISYMWRLGEVTKTLALFKEARDRGRTQRAANSLGYLWDYYDRANLSDPSVVVFFEENGLADYWRKHGDPDYCRVDGDNIECDTP